MFKSFFVNLNKRALIVCKIKQNKHISKLFLFFVYFILTKIININVLYYFVLFSRGVEFYFLKEISSLEKKKS